MSVKHLQLHRQGAQAQQADGCPAQMQHYNTIPDEAERSLPVSGLSTVAFTTLGCKVNLYDTEAVAGFFRRRGYTVVDFAEVADVYVINTCSVTNMGARKSRQIIRRAIKRNPGAIVVAMGCYTQYAPDEVANIEGVDVLVGTNQKAQIVDMVEEAARSAQVVNGVENIMTVRTFSDVEALHYEGRTRAVLKVQDGCNEFCSYCQIPWARGRNRSRLPERVLEEVFSLTEQGFPEIVLTGVHMGTYGEDLTPATSLAELVHAVAQVPGVKRLRLSSVDPNEVTPALIDAIAMNANVCRHLHIPAQSGEDGILTAMRRRNNTQEYRELVQRLRDSIPGLAITTDVIVGFPGETDESFAQTYSFCADIGFQKIHVFPYSRRKGTRADKMPNHLPEEVKHARAQELIKLSDALALRHHQELLGQELTVLVEGDSDRNPGYIQGLTDTYVRVHCPVQAQPGDFVVVRAAEAASDGIVAAPAVLSGGL